MQKERLFGGSNSADELAEMMPPVFQQESKVVFIRSPLFSDYYPRNKHRSWLYFISHHCIISFHILGKMIRTMNGAKASRKWNYLTGYNKTKYSLPLREKPSIFTNEYPAHCAVCLAKWKQTTPAFKGESSWITARCVITAILITLNHSTPSNYGFWRFSYWRISPLWLPGEEALRSVCGRFSRAYSFLQRLSSYQVFF